MNFLCATRTFWLPDQPKVTEYGQVAFISRSVAILGQQGTIKEAPRGAAGSIAASAAAAFSDFGRDFE
jgi:hypothetical protein